VDASEGVPEPSSIYQDSYSKELKRSYKNGMRVELTPAFLSSGKTLVEQVKVPTSSNIRGSIKK
jgi:hypothetical protein